MLWPEGSWSLMCCPTGPRTAAKASTHPTYGNAFTQGISCYLTWKDKLVLPSAHAGGPEMLHWGAGSQAGPSPSSKLVCVQKQTINHFKDARAESLRDDL